jgi:hypothetical protein
MASTSSSTGPSTGQPPGRALGLDQIEGVFGFSFTPAERQLLTMRKDLLGVRDGQRRYVLQMALQPCECPRCGYLVCQRSAATAPYSTDTSTPDDAYACPYCQAALTWHLGLVGGAQWFTMTRP